METEVDGGEEGEREGAKGAEEYVKNREVEIKEGWQSGEIGHEGSEVGGMNKILLTSGNKNALVVFGGCWLRSVRILHLLLWS